MIFVNSWIIFSVQIELCEIRYNQQNMGKRKQKKNKFVEENEALEQLSQLSQYLSPVNERQLQIQLFRLAQAGPYGDAYDPPFQLEQDITQDGGPSEQFQINHELTPVIGQRSPRNCRSEKNIHEQNCTLLLKIEDLRENAKKFFSKPSKKKTKHLLDLLVQDLDSQKIIANLFLTRRYKRLIQMNRVQNQALKIKNSQAFYKMIKQKLIPCIEKRTVTQNPSSSN